MSVKLSPLSTIRFLDAAGTGAPMGVVVTPAHRH